MDFDFAGLLVGLTALFGFIWLMDRLFFAARRRRKAEADDTHYKEPWIVDWSRSLFPVILLVLVLRSFVAEPFRIPSGSMMPTLNVGDFILVNKFAYGLRLPVTNTKFIDIGEPQRGDIVVFRPPWAHDQNWIKRVIGLPGDRVVMRGQDIWVNGEKIDASKVAPYRGNADKPEERTILSNGGAVFAESMNGKTYQTIQMTTAHMAPDLPNAKNPEIVPEGCYLVMGDNRDNSQDSRYEGCIPETDMVGKAFFIWFSLSSLSRIGTVLH